MVGTISRRRLVLVVAFVAALLAVPAVQVAATSGTLSVTTDTTLTEDHNGPIVIDADNVTLDCAGHTVTGPGRLQGLPGINMFQRTGVTVKNCVVQNFNDAFRVSQSNGNTFTNNSVSHLRQGFTLLGSDNNTLTGNSAMDATDFFGFGFLDGSQGNLVAENSATGNLNGFAIYLGANNNVFQNNVASDNTNSGFNLFDGAITVGNTFTGNSAHSNGLPGFRDESTGGTGDAGTDNSYSSNLCVGNTNGGSDPVGLCDPSGSFGDDDGSIFELDIEWLAGEGITAGCNPPVNDLFCPADNVTRGQMATFLVRALGLAPSDDDGPFTDHLGSVHRRNINALRIAGITSGCAADRFCPANNVTRAQMGTFLTNALGLTPSDDDGLFTDHVGSVHRRNINALRISGITAGCNPPDNTMFCPADPVKRRQMAAFLRRALA